MKYYFGAACVLLGAWLVYRGLTHRRAMISAGAEHGERQITRRLQGLQSMRVGLAPLYVLIVAFAGIVLTVLWFAVDQGRVFSILDMIGFLAVILAYAFWMYIQIRYSRLGLDRAD